MRPIVSTAERGSPFGSVSPVGGSRIQCEEQVSIRLFVGNLPYEASEADVRELFSSVAPPLKVVLPVDRETGRPRGFAFVEYGDRAQGEDAVQRLNAQPYKGRTLSVSEARPREERPAGFRPSGPGPMGPRPGGPPGMRPSGPPRPGGFAPRAPFDGGEAPGREGTRRTFGPPKKKTQQRYDNRPKGPIREKTHSRLMDLDEDPRFADETGEFDDIATAKPEDDDAGTE
jgi:RNA recognition motif-containing protein